MKVLNTKGKRVERKGFPQDWMSQLKSKNDIVSVVSRYVHLQQKGKNFWGCCPFHTEKTPSFAVNPEENFFHCFGCKEGGDAISFVEKIESVEFGKAIEMLASWAGMEVPQLEGNEDIVIRKQKKEMVLKILDETKNFFISNLDKPNAINALEYIARRALTKHDLEKFQIGASLDWSSLVLHLKKKGYTPEEMKEAGVIEIKEGHPYDVMAERLTFPIFNSFNECIAFSARVLVPTDFAKYKNTGDTIVFNKSRAIFGINHIKKLKNEKGLKYIVIVEGQMDVIAMHQAGFENTVACMGTALTPEHAHELKRFSENIICCFDGDLAGRKATLRSLDILKNEGLNVKVASITQGGKDPDEYIKANGIAAMQKILDDALPATDYKIVTLSKEFDLTEPSGNAQFVSKAMEIVKSLSSAAEKDIYLGLVKQLSNVPIDILRRDLNGHNVIAGTSGKQVVQNKIQAVDSIGEAIKFVFAAILHRQPYATLSNNFDEYLTSNDEKIIYDYLIGCQEKNEKPFAGAIFELFDQDSVLAKEIVDINFDVEGFDGARNFDACMWILVEAKLKQRQQELLAKFKTETNLEERKNILGQINTIAQNLMKKNWRDSQC